MLPEIIEGKNKNEIIMRRKGERIWTVLALPERNFDRCCEGIKPGDKFTRDGVEFMIIGFTKNFPDIAEGKPSEPFSLMWAVQKIGKNMVFRSKEDELYLRALHHNKVGIVAFNVGRETFEIRQSKFFVPCRVPINSETAKERIEEFFNS